MPPELKRLMLRYCQLGRLLPPRDDIADFDVGQLAGIQLVLDEMGRVKAQIDAFLTAARARRTALAREEEGTDAEPVAG